MALRWGICSAGSICHAFGASLKLLDPKEHQMVAVGARDKSRAQKYADLFGIPRAYGSYEELARDANVEVVYIGAIATQHVKLGLMMLNAGKHVLCEMPLALNAKDASKLIDAAKKNNVFLMEAIWTRCLPVYDQLRKELAAGSVGEVKLVNSLLSNFIMDVPSMCSREMGRGSTIDLGVYGIQLATMVFKDKPLKVIAAGHLMETGADETVSITLVYSNNRLATITSSYNTSLCTRDAIIGTTGMMETKDITVSPTILVTPEKTYDFPFPEPTMKVEVEWGEPSTGYVYEAKEVRRCIREGLKECPVMTHADSLQIIEIIDEVRRQVGVVYDQDSQ